MTPFDPFAGGDAARDALAAVTKRLKDDPGLSDEEAEAIMVVVTRVSSALASDTGKAEKVMKVADQLAGFVKDPRSLLSLIGL